MSSKNKTMTWDETTIPMKEQGFMLQREVMGALSSITTDPPLLKMSEDWHNEIIKLMYSKVDIQEYYTKLEHLTETEGDALAKVLSQYLSMYEGAIGMLNIPPVHFELRPGVRLFYSWPFPIPKAFEKLTKDECCHFESADIWEHTRDSE